MAEYQINDNRSSNVESEIDTLLFDKPEALRKVRDNRKFIHKIQTNQVKPEFENVKVFGVKNVNINNILKDNIWNRGIFTVDKLCRMHRKMTYEQLKKYQSKKRHVPMNMIWIIILMFGIIIAIVVIIIFLQGGIF